MNQCRKDYYTKSSFTKCFLCGIDTPNTHINTYEKIRFRGKKFCDECRPPLILKFKLKDRLYDIVVSKENEIKLSINYFYKYLSQMTGIPREELSFWNTVYDPKSKTKICPAESSNLITHVYLKSDKNINH